MFDTLFNNRTTLPARVCVLLLLSLSAGFSYGEPSVEKLTDGHLSLASACETALRDNPGLAQMQARYDALAEIPSQAGSLSDPVISFNAMNFPTDTFDRDQEAMTQIQIGIAQEFPFPGKRSLRKDAAKHEANAAKHSVDEMRLRLTNNVSMKWWQVFFLDRALDTVDSNQQLLHQFIEVAQKKYEVGNGLQQDVLLAQLELSKLVDQQIQLTGMRRNQTIQLNVLMGKSHHSDTRLPINISTVMPTIAGEERLYTRAQSKRPLLREMDQHIEAAQSRLNLAEKGYYPDFKVGLIYGDRQGDNPPPRNGSRSDFLSLMVGIKIPLYAGQKQSRAIKQRSSELAKNRFALLDTSNNVRGDISSAANDYRQAKELFSLFGTGIVPQAKQTVDSMLAGYQVSQVDFLNLVRSQVTLFNYELQYWRAFTEAKQALARLEAAVGEESIYE